MVSIRVWNRGSSRWRPLKGRRREDRETHASSSFGEINSRSPVVVLSVCVIPRDQIPNVTTSSWPNVMIMKSEPREHHTYVVI